jgi:ATP-dependent exoDNAse (exonuclease V) beta subunit
MSINDFYAEPEQEPQVTPTEQAKKAKTVSFSQYAMWLKCPMQWKLSYIDKLAPYEASIHTVFGTGIHEALQEYLRVLYTQGATEADGIDTFSIFKKSFEEGLKELKIADEEQSKLNEDELDALGLTTSATIAEFENDGKIILDHVLSYAQRSKHFPSKKYEVVGIELPLEIPMRNGNILYKGFLDIVLKEKATGKILILDFKTSTRGWNKYQKADRTKIDQLLLYKRFYHQTFKIPMSDIEVEFFVVKRKLLEDVEFPQQRIQRISPPDGKTSMREVETAFLDFINNGFDANGEYNKDAVFLKNPGKARKNCKYCVFKTLKSPEGKLYCDGKEG